MVTRRTESASGWACTPRVLIVEDDQGLRESLALVLEVQGYDSVHVPSVEAAIPLLAEGFASASGLVSEPRGGQPSARPPFDALVLDLNLPGADGTSLCRWVRARDLPLPILMLTARHAISDRVAGLESGADDYLAKPFALDELLARLRSMLRRSGSLPEPGPEVLRFLDLELRPASRLAFRSGEALQLTKLEFDLLELFLAHPGVVLTKDRLADELWPPAAGAGASSLMVFVSNLRKKLEVDGAARVIQTVRGVGYVLREDP